MKPPEPSTWQLTTLNVHRSHLMGLNSRNTFYAVSNNSLSRAVSVEPSIADYRAGVECDADLDAVVSILDTNLPSQNLFDPCLF